MTASVTSRGSESLLSKTGFSALAGVLAVVGRMIASIGASRMLGPEKAGELAYLLWVAETLAIMSGLGLPAAATRFTADLRGQGRLSATMVVRWMYFLYVALASAGTAVGFIIANSTVSGRQFPMLKWYFAAYFLLFAIGTFHIAYLTGHQDFRRIARINALSTLLLVAAAFTLTPIWGLQGALLAYLAGALPIAAVQVRVRHEVAKSSDDAPELRSRIFRYAIYTWYGAIMAAFTWSRAEIFFLEKYWGAGEVSMFTVGTSLSLLATQGPLLLVGALLAHFAQLRGAGQIGVIKSLFVSGTRLMAVLLFPLCFGLASITPVLLPLVYGQAFARAVPNAIVLIASSAVSISMVSSSLLYAMEKPKVIAILSTAGAVATVLGGYLAVSRYGAWGAAWSRSAVQITMVAITMIYIARGLQVPVPTKDLLKTVLAAAISAGSSALLVWRLGEPAALILAVPLAGGIYLVVLRYTRVLHPHDTFLIGQVVARVPAQFRAPADFVLRWVSGG